MDSEWWRKVEEAYHTARELSGEERDRFLDTACKADAAMRRQIKVLLHQDENPDSLLSKGAAGLLDDATVNAVVPGTLLGSYRIEAQVGEGGMGVVYRARDTKLNRTVAIKFLSDELADAAARRRFQREAQTASSLNHPHILTVHDAGEFEGRQYLVTEFIDGGTLEDWIREKQPTWRQIVELLMGIADGLATAHTAGILHRDIKPANILVGRNGYAKLVDFGLAKLQDAGELEVTRKSGAPTRPGVVIGTVAYMSPEQASGKPLDTRSDIFSFGVTLYEALARYRPFEGGTTLELMQAVIHVPPKPLPATIPVALRMLIEKALEKDPADRYQSMRDLVVDLRRIARQTDAPGAVSPARKKSRGWVWIAAAVLTVMLIAGIFFWRNDSVPQNPVQYVQLTNFADSATQPALSPDGRMMAFVRGPDTFMGPGQIYVKLLPSGDPVQLTRDDVLKMAPRFSTDGTRIAYSTLGSSGWETWVVPVLGGQAPRRFLANAEGLAWIQERTEGGASQARLLFSEMTGKGITMAIVSSTESRSEQRTVYVQDGIMDHFSYLSPDGKQLLLAEMGFNGWQPCRLVPYDGSSRGRKVGPAPSQCTNAAWSPDGKWMYFSADTGSGFHIWRQRSPDGTPEQITSGATEEEGIEFAPDGRSFLTSIGTHQSTLWIHDSRGDRQVTSEAYTFLPSFSYDGKKLYYLVREAGGIHTIRGGLWVMDVGSGERQRLLPDYLIEHYTISPDGQRVVFVSANDTGRTGVWLATLDGQSAPRRLSGSEGLQAFFGTGGDVFFAAQEKEGTFIYRVKEDGSGLKKVMVPHAVYFLFGVSPDGKYVAAWVNGSTEDTANAVFVYPVEGGSATMICGTCGGRSSEEPGFLSWSPDGKFLYISTWRQATYAIPLRAGQILPPLPAAGIRSAQDAAALPGAKPFPVAGAFAGPDPSVYAYAKLTAQRNIYRVPVP
jgi:serine/threonine protein kinase/WD40 repeat protein